uniref:Fumarate lyase N-terminal domain-containing protein n=1 Tax=Phenylobacterium glaciei TaxID=2803784 RepID=A0A974P643_9CAUL|nr:hypothetical protein JKL49_13245 [Phenylobacterium glaciei]
MIFSRSSRDLSAASTAQPLDGRYFAAVSELSDYLSEAGLNRARVEVEVEWLIALTDRSLFGASPVSEADKARLRALYTEFGQAEIDWLAKREAITRHDVKAVEYLVRDRLEQLGLGAVAELTHFACTSEDINSTAYALTVKRAVTRVWLPKLQAVTQMLSALAAAHRDAPMLAHTHGQPATPPRWARRSAYSPGGCNGSPGRSKARSTWRSFPAPRAPGARTWPLSRTSTGWP